MDSRFSDATNATPPRRACPARSMFLAALWSRCRLVPHSGRLCHRTERPLAGERRRHGDYPLPGTCCLESEDGEKRAPPRIADALGEMVILDHIGHLQVFMIDHVVLSNE